MKALTCEMCGSTNLIKQDGVFVCQQCGTKYSVEEARKMMVEGTVSVQGTVSVDNSQRLENLYILGRRAIQNKSIEGVDYYKRILEMDPYSKEAIFMCDCFEIKKYYGEHYLDFDPRKTAGHTAHFSDGEKKLVFGILRRYYIDGSYWAISERIKCGQIDERIQEWGDCYKEEWIVDASQSLSELYKEHNDYLTNSFGKEPENKRIEKIRENCQRFHTILNKLQELNPSMDLQEYNEKISQMESDLRKLVQEIEPILDQPVSESQEKKDAERQETSTNWWYCGLAIILICIAMFFFIFVVPSIK